LSEDPIWFAGGDTNLYRYVQNNPVRYTDPYGLLVLDLIGNAGLLNSAPESQALLSSLQNDPNTLVVISSGSAGGSFGTTSGNSSLMSVTIDQSMQANSSVLANTLTHELTHAHDIRSGNFNFNDPNRRDIPTVERHGENVANPLFDRDNMCR